MCDPFDEQRPFAMELVSTVTAALGRMPSFDGLLTRQSARVVIVNADAGEQTEWIEQARLIGGPDISVIFVVRPLDPRDTGASMVAARGRGTLDFKDFECGCRAARIPGEDDWQLVRGSFCRFAPDAHKRRA